MEQSKERSERIQAAIAFHGHSCPGLAYGIRAAEVALERLGRSADEEVVAMVETDMCGVDAIQFLTGCTFGKGNLIHLDYGKNAFTFFRRSDGEGFRILTRPAGFRDLTAEMGPLRRKMAAGALSPEERARMEALKDDYVRRILEADAGTLFDIRPAEGPVPKKARIMESLTCEGCGEAVMESRTRRLAGKTLCIPCFKSEETRL